MRFATLRMSSTLPSPSRLPTCDLLPCAPPPARLQNSEFVIKLKSLEDGLLSKLSAAQVNKSPRGGKGPQTQPVAAAVEAQPAACMIAPFAKTTHPHPHSQGDLTEDEALIISLEESKALADEISEKVG